MLVTAALSTLLGSNWPAEPVSLWVETQTQNCLYRICQPSKIPLVVCVNECACTCTCTSAHCGCLWLVCHWSKPAGSHHYSSALDLCPHIKIPLIHPLLSPGEISTRSVLDREQQSSYQLVVVVQDGGSPSRSATGTAFITVLDDNDNDPAFTHSQTGKNLIIQVMSQSQKHQQAEIEVFHIFNYIYVDFQSVGDRGSILWGFTGHSASQRPWWRREWHPVLLFVRYSTVR